MNRFLRVSIIAVAVVLLTLLGTGVVLAATVATSVATDGLVLVSIHEKGPDGVHFTAPIPASLLRYGVAIASTTHGDDLAEARRQLEPYTDSVLRIVDELAKADDFDLVRVEDGDELVTVQKRGGQLVVDVDSDDARIHVTLPLRLVGQVISSLG